MNAIILRKIGCKTKNINNNILIIDSACDKSIINGNAFLVLSRSEHHYHVNGALSGHIEPEVPLEVVDAIKKVILKNGSIYILQMN